MEQAFPLPLPYHPVGIVMFYIIVMSVTFLLWYTIIHTPVYKLYSWKLSHGILPLLSYQIGQYNLMSL